jgi:hypothetical protein
MEVVVDVETPLKPEQRTQIQRIKKRCHEFFCSGPTVLFCLCCTVLFALILGMLIANEIEFSK